MPCLKDLRPVVVQMSGKPMTHAMTDEDRAAFYDDDLMNDEFKQTFPLLCEDCREYAEALQWKRKDVQAKSRGIREEPTE